ncbi:hypothetical protein [Sorangium sp. So ce1097]|uniref:hypothetical protein n=1 Tax=Sorangium sp. So ce1097 TaxID=3133330 RepID=UPI003F61C254
MSEFTTDQNETLRELGSQLQGYWHIIKAVAPPSIVLVDNVAGTQLASLTKRYADMRVWWDNGPRVYVATYAHSISPITAEIKQVNLKLVWRNQGGGIEKHEIVSDHVTCRERDKWSNWSFSITPEQAEYIQRLDALVLGEPTWSKCE